MKNKAEYRMDPFNGKFDRVKEELSKVLLSQYSGTLHDAVLLGSLAIQVSRLLDGQHEITEQSYVVKTSHEE
jgi:hypothetical protein